MNSQIYKALQQSKDWLDFKTKFKINEKFFPYWLVCYFYTYTYSHFENYCRQYITDIVLCSKVQYFLLEIKLYALLFILGENVFHKFVNNCEKQKKQNYINFLINYRGYNCRIAEIINMSFTWAFTPENSSHLFWAGIHKDLCNYTSFDVLWDKINLKSLNFCNILEQNNSIF